MALLLTLAFIAASYLLYRYDRSIPASLQGAARLLLFVAVMLSVGGTLATVGVHLHSNYDDDAGYRADSR